MYTRRDQKKKRTLNNKQKKKCQRRNAKHLNQTKKEKKGGYTLSTPVRPSVEHPATAAAARENRCLKPLRMARPRFQRPCEMPGRGRRTIPVVPDPFSPAYTANSCKRRSLILSPFSLCFSVTSCTHFVTPNRSIGASIVTAANLRKFGTVKVRRLTLENSFT